MIDEAFLERLSNWRRVYGDRRILRHSSTFVICQYLRAYADRLPETDKEQYWREAEELRNREPPQPAPDYKDADFLQLVWSRMPDNIGGMMVKNNIKVFVFGTEYDYRTLRRKAGIRRDFERAWQEINLRAFQERVYTEQQIQKDLQLENL